MHPMTRQQLAADHVNDMIAAAAGSPGAPQGTHSLPPLPLEPRPEEPLPTAAPVPAVFAELYATPHRRCAMCPHQPSCPPADRPDRHAAHTVAFHPEQGWSLLCNGVIVFDDMGEIVPGGRVLPPHRPAHVRLPAAA